MNRISTLIQSMNAPFHSDHAAVRPRQGMTLIELSVVILVILSLISLLFVAAGAWKRGSDRAACTVQIRQVQVAVRSYANLNNIEPGTDISPVSLQAAVIGSGAYLEATPTCPSNGLYTFNGNTIPALGDLYMTCSLSASEGHVPDSYEAW